MERTENGENSKINFNFSNKNRKERRAEKAYDNYIEFEKQQSKPRKVEKKFIKKKVLIKKTSRGLGTGVLLALSCYAIMQTMGADSLATKVDKVIETTDYGFSDTSDGLLIMSDGSIINTYGAIRSIIQESEDKGMSYGEAYVGLKQWLGGQGYPNSIESALNKEKLPSFSESCAIKTKEFFEKKYDKSKKN